MTVLTSQKSFQLDLEIQTTMRLCQVVDTPRALTVWLLLKYGEHQQYLDLTIDPSLYDCHNKFRDDYMVTKILSKSPNLHTGIDLKQAAVLSFIESEAQCKKTNDRFMSYGAADYPPFWWDMQQIVRKVLPTIDRRLLDRVLESCDHGPGSTTGVRGVGSSVVEKYSQQLHLTTGLIPFYRSIVGDLWASVQRAPKKIVRGSKFTTVPKNAKTDRGICVEPTLNIYLQKGIGAVIRDRLRVFGIDLDRQAERNRDAARRAYKDELCTIDLKAASDSIASVMLERLLPPDWWHLLQIARSPCTKVNGDWVTLEKVSSMGNGYTFELESLIFSSLAWAIVPKNEWHDVHVFGDDIVIPRKYARSFIDALAQLGFSVNGSKTFLDGNFFESCGTDWFRGKPVRPLFLKGADEHIPYTVQTANRLRVFAAQRSVGWCDSRFREIWIKLVKSSPKEWRKCRVPIELGDIGITTSEQEILHRRPLSEPSHEGYRILTIATRSRSRSYRCFPVLLAAYARRALLPFATMGRMPIRGLFGKARPRWTSVTTWSSGLEWDS